MRRVDSDRGIDDYGECDDDYVSPGPERVFTIQATMRMMGEIPPVRYEWDDDEEWS